MDENVPDLTQSPMSSSPAKSMETNMNMSIPDLVLSPVTSSPARSGEASLSLDMTPIELIQVAFSSIFIKCKDFLFQLKENKEDDGMSPVSVSSDIYSSEEEQPKGGADINMDLSVVETLQELPYFMDLDTDEESSNLATMLPFYNCTNIMEAYNMKTDDSLGHGESKPHSAILSDSVSPFPSPNSSYGGWWRYGGGSYYYDSDQRPITDYFKGSGGGGSSTAFGLRTKRTKPRLTRKLRKRGLKSSRKPNSKNFENVPTSSIVNVHKSDFMSDDSIFNTNQAGSWL